MQRLSEQILAHAEGLPEGAPVSAKGLLHLGNRAAVDQALSRLAERGNSSAPAAVCTSAPSRVDSARERLPSSRRSKRSRPSGARSSSRMGPPQRMRSA